MTAHTMNSWLPEAVAFLQATQSALSALPAALLTVHGLNSIAEG